jgi:hypothetical protein
MYKLGRRYYINKHRNPHNNDIGTLVDKTLTEGFFIIEKSNYIHTYLRLKEVRDSYIYTFNHKKLNMYLEDKFAMRSLVDMIPADKLVPNTLLFRKLYPEAINESNHLRINL